MVPGRTETESVRIVLLLFAEWRREEDETGYESTNERRVCKDACMHTLTSSEPTLIF